MLERKWILILTTNTFAIITVTCFILNLSQNTKRGEILIYNRGGSGYLNKQPTPVNTRKLSLDDGIFKGVFFLLRDLFLTGVNWVKTIWSGVVSLTTGLKIVAKPLKYLLSGLKWVIDLLV